ncbi:MAG: hypothetical protein A2016_12030 [Elusimicrobia bacterium GWF2_62_30]|nr:MAG: hypothetical protein A2016_12030 [Elusimicrobia bacterium GWF2_62_30]
MKRTQLAAAALLLAFTCPLAGAEDARRRYQLIDAEGRPEGKPALDLSGTRIVFYGEPGGAFSIQALGDLSKDDTAKTALLARGFFITPAGSLAAAAAWNKDSPYEYFVMYSVQDWPELALTAEPRIFFYDDETPVCDLKGWSGAQSAAGFGGCLEKAGLLSAPARVESALALLRLADAGGGWAEEEKRLAHSGFRTLLKEGAFAAAKLVAYDDRALKNAYSLAANYSFYTPEQDSLAAQSEILAELGNRGLANENRAQYLHKGLLDARLFEKASALKELYPAFELQQVPPITGSLKTKPGELAVYSVKDGGAALEIIKIKKGGPRIVVAARPGCHFADMALAAIEKDPELAPVFEKYSLPLVSKMDLPSLGSWNKAHRLQYRVTVSAGDWPGVDFSFSPTFYFIRDGRILHTARGWSDEDSFRGIYKGLARLFPKMKLRGRPGKKELKSGKPETRRRLQRPVLGSYLRGLTGAQFSRFCSSLRFKRGVLTGAYMGDIKEVFGEKRAEELYGFFAGKPAAGAPQAAGGVTLGELWKGLEPEQLNRTCATIEFNGGEFGGLNFGDLTDVFGEKAVEETFSFFSPPGTDGAKP